MSKCPDCKQEMLEARTCLIEEDELGKRDNEYFDVNVRCHDCGIINMKGNFHHPGCDIERCSKCGGQKLGDDCVLKMQIN